MYYEQHILAGTKTTIEGFIKQITWRQELLCEQVFGCPGTQGMRRCSPPPCTAWPWRPKSSVGLAVLSSWSFVEALKIGVCELGHENYAMSIFISVSPFIVFPHQSLTTK